MGLTELRTAAGWAACAHPWASATGKVWPQPHGTRGKFKPRQSCDQETTSGQSPPRSSCKTAGLRASLLLVWKTGTSWWRWAVVLALLPRFPGLLNIHLYEGHTDPGPRCVTQTCVYVRVPARATYPQKHNRMWNRFGPRKVNVGLSCFSEMHPWNNVDLYLVWSHMAPNHPLYKQDPLDRIEKESPQKLYFFLWRQCRLEICALFVPLTNSAFQCVSI